MLAGDGEVHIAGRRKGLGQPYEELITQVRSRINWSAVNKNFVMQVGSGSSAGHPHGADHLASTYFLTHHHIEGSEVSKLGGNAITKV